MFDLLDGWPDENNEPSTPNKSEPSFISELIERKRYTPDFKNIRLHEDNLVFVYDEFQKGGAYNRNLSEGKYLGKGKTAYNQYQMKLTTVHPSSPVVFLHNVVNPGFIRGEVYAVPPETIQILDRLNRNGQVFSRTEKSIFLLDQTYTTKKGPKSPSVKCWMYIGIRSFWEDKKLNSAGSMIPYNSSNKRYYEYTPTQLNYYGRRGSPWATVGMTEEEREEWMRNQYGQEYLM